MEQFYREVYQGEAFDGLPQALARAEDMLQRYQRDYQVSGTEQQRKLALCAMAQAIAYFDAAQNGEGGLRYARVGSVSVTGKGIYSQVDISPQAQEAEIYRAACRYLQIYRGVGSC